MPKRVPVETVILHRDGKQFAPEIGKVFDFTEQELADINAVNKFAVRKPVVEEKPAEEVKPKTEEELAAEAEAAEQARQDAQAAIDAAAAQQKTAADKAGAKGAKATGKSSSKDADL